MSCAAAMLAHTCPTICIAMYIPDSPGLAMSASGIPFALPAAVDLLDMLFQQYTTRGEVETLEDRNVFFTLR